MQESLVIDVTREKIMGVTRNMPKNKDPGLDGYPIVFYLAAWNVIGESMISTFMEYFGSGMLLKELNAIIISLI